MNAKEVIEFFGTQEKTAEALLISQSAISQWGDIVPKPRRGHVELAMKAEQERRDAEAKKLARREARKKAKQ